MIDDTTAPTLRLRIEQNADVCLGDHRIDRATKPAEGVAVYTITCDGATIGWRGFSTAMPHSDKVAAWSREMLITHDRAVARAVILELLEELGR